MNMLYFCQFMLINQQLFAPHASNETSYQIFVACNPELFFVGRGYFRDFFMNKIKIKAYNCKQIIYFYLPI